MITPAHIQGHWVRDWIKAPGFEDHTTRVHWMQAGDIYADVRIPHTRPNAVGATCLADLNPAALTTLAKAEGFAGTTTLDGDTCTWLREINWHGTPDEPDVGAISFDVEGRMIETGVHADYSELWTQKAKGTTAARCFSNNIYTGVFVFAADVGVLGIGQPVKVATTPARNALNRGTIPDNADTVFDGLHALCKVDGPRVTAVLATNPFVETQTILTLGETDVTWHKTGFDGTQQNIHLPITRTTE